MQGTQNLESQQTDITSVFKRTTDYQGEPQNHTVADCFYYDFFFLLHNTLKIFADLVSGFSCSGRTLIGKMRANACS